LGGFRSAVTRIWILPGRGLSHLDFHRSGLISLV